MTADGTLHPWVQDHDGIWHRRPADDEWNDDPHQAQANTVCGRAIQSVSCSAVHPHQLPQPAGDPEQLCPACTQVPLIPAATYYVGAACGVPHGFRPIYFRLSHEEKHGGYEGMARLIGYELDDQDQAVERRDIYVIVAGLKLLALPDTRSLARAVRATRNDPPAAVRIPRQRRPEPTGRNR